MIAPDELSTNRKTPLGETAAATTQRKPTTVEVKIAQAGTPFRLSLSSRSGASLRAASTNNMREAVYSPELRQDRTAVKTTKFITSAAKPMFIRSNAAT